MPFQVQNRIMYPPSFIITYNVNFFRYDINFLDGKGIVLRVTKGKSVFLAISEGKRVIVILKPQTLALLSLVLTVLFL